MNSSLHPDINTIYIMCHPEDRDGVFGLYEALKKNREKVILPLFYGKPRELRQTEEEMLMACDVAILYCGAGNTDWLYSKEIIIKKMAGYHRDQLPVGLYLAAPFAGTQEIDGGGALFPVIDGRERVPDDLLDQINNLLTPS